MKTTNFSFFNFFFFSDYCIYFLLLLLFLEKAKYHWGKQLSNKDTLIPCVNYNFYNNLKKNILISGCNVYSETSVLFFLNQWHNQMDQFERTYSDDQFNISNLPYAKSPLDGIGQFFFFMSSSILLKLNLMVVAGITLLSVKCILSIFSKKYK